MSTTTNSARIPFQLLILDADPESRKVLVNLSNEFQAAFIVHEAPSIEAALEALKQKKFDLLVADTRTPSKHAGGFLQELAQIPAESAPKAIFVVSATVDEFEITVDLPTATLHTFTLNPDVYQKNLAEHFKLTAPARKSKQVIVEGLDVQFMNHFMDATVTMMLNFGKMDVLREGLYLKSPKHISGDISATMDVLGDHHKASFTVAMEESIFCEMASRVVGKAVTKIDPQYQDIAGELCNQIFGIAKKTLNDMGLAIRQGLPTVRIQSRHAVQHNLQGPCVAVRFSSEFGMMQIEAILVED